MSYYNLVKIGNIKIGERRKGQPIVREGLLVTQAVKDNEDEIFLPFPGFNRKGVESLDVVLPFDDGNLNFEVGYVSFATIKFYSKTYKELSQVNKEQADTLEDNVKYDAIVPYIIKEVQDKDANVIMGQPLSEYAQNVEAPFILFGQKNDSLIQELKMEYTGILKCMIHKVSGLGEVFHFKTKSKATINAIQSQLTLLDRLTNHQTAGLVLKMKPYRKQYNKNVFPFIDLALPATSSIEVNQLLQEHLEARKCQMLSIQDLEEEFKNKYPSLINCSKFNPKNMEIEFESNMDVVHEIVDEVEENATSSTKRAEVETLTNKLAERFQITSTQKTMFTTLVKRMSEHYHDVDTLEAEIISEIEKVSNENEGKIPLKMIADLVKKYTK